MVNYTSVKMKNISNPAVTKTVWLDITARNRTTGQMSSGLQVYELYFSKTIFAYLLLLSQYSLKKWRPQFLHSQDDTDHLLTVVCHLPPSHTLRRLADFPRPHHPGFFTLQLPLGFDQYRRSVVKGREREWASVLTTCPIPLGCCSGSSAFCQGHGSPRGQPLFQCSNSLPTTPYPQGLVPQTLPCPFRPG